MLENSDSASRLAIKRKLSYFAISLLKLRESLTINWLWVKYSNIRYQKLCKIISKSFNSGKVKDYFFDKSCFSLEVSSWDDKLKIALSVSGEEVANIPQLKLGIKLFSFGRCLNFIRSNSFSLDMSDIFKMWLKFIMFKADITFL